MTDPLIAARFYLTPPAGHFWLWSEDGEVVIWQRGATIAFRKELKVVVERLAPRGLPAFDEILLLFASCRWDSAPSTDLIIAMFESDSGENDGGSSWPYEAFSSIDQMWRLPADVREPLEAKALLAEVVFETRPPIVSPEVARVVVELLDTASPAGFSQRVEFLGTARTGTLRQSVDYLIRGMQRVDVEALRLRRRTGLDVPPQPAETEDDPQTSPGELIARLSEDAELGGMARLARNLLAVTDLPRSVSDSDELPLGGVSDIGNRGSFDRLLLSELAQDDLTLSVRVALNEALYLRRESPPRTPPQRRLILIDSGLRMWGVPRVFAASVALAFAARTSKGAESAAWRAAGESLEPVDLRTRSGLVEHLEALDATLHAGDSLPAFRHEIEQNEGPPEVVIIIEADTLDDETFVRALDESAPPRIFLATVRRNGEFRLWLRTPAGRKLIREATLDLERILFEAVPRPVRHVPLIDKSQQPLPAIFRVRPFPLQMPHRVRPTQVGFEPGTQSFFSVAGDGRLMWWSTPEQGAIQLAEDIPVGRIHWADVNSLEVSSFLVQRGLNDTSLVQFALDAACTSDRVVVRALNLDWKFGHVKGAWHQGEVLIIVGEKGRRFAAYNRKTGEFLGERRLTDHLLTRVGSPYVVRSTARQNNRHEYELAVVRWHQHKLDLIYQSTAGRRLTWYRGGTDSDLPIIRPAAGVAFDAHGIDGPLAILPRSGELLNIETGASRPLSVGMPTPIRVIEIDDSGGTALVEAFTAETSLVDGTQRFVIDTKSGHRTQVPNSVNSIAEWKISKWTRPKPVRKKWTGILSDTSTLILESRNRTYWKLKLSGNRLLAVQTVSRTSLRRFVSLPAGPAGYRLQTATWTDGSRVTLDARGMLHLQSSDPQIPEATLVIAEDGLSGWCVDGRVFGDPYLIGNKTPTDAETIFREILQPFAQRCPRHG